jgi:hypothetical protein
LDVHPPHEPIRSWKDFLLHLLTITIGLFIALSLEAAVEAMHYRHIVRDAKVNLRREIAQNHELYAKNMRSLEKNLEILERDIDQLRDIRAGHPPEHLDLHWNFGWNAYDDTAWNTARDVGAISHMQPETLEIYAGIYGQQEYVNQAGAAILFDEAKAGAPILIAKNHSDARELLPVDIQSLLQGSAELSARLDTLRSIMHSLDELYSASLREP